MGRPGGGQGGLQRKGCEGGGVGTAPSWSTKEPVTTPLSVIGSVHQVLTTFHHFTLIFAMESRNKKLETGTLIDPELFINR